MFILKEKDKGFFTAVDLTDSLEEEISAGFANRVLKSGIGVIEASPYNFDIDFYKFCVEQRNSRAKMLGKRSLQVELAATANGLSVLVNMKRGDKLADFDLVCGDNLYVPYGTEIIGGYFMSVINKHKGTLIFPATLKYLSKTTYDCKRIVFRDNIEGRLGLNLEKAVFMGTNVSQIVLPNTLQQLPSNAFEYANVSEVILPPTLKEIQDRAFLRCWELSHIELPESLSFIGDAAFEESGLTSIFIPKGVVLRDYVFSRCMSLEKVHLPEDLKALPWGLFSECFGLKEIFIPDSVVEFGRDVFRACRSLSSVNMTASLLKKQLDCMDCNMFPFPAAYSAVSVLTLRFISPCRFTKADVKNIHLLFPLLKKIVIQGAAKSKVSVLEKDFQVEVV